MNTWLEHLNSRLGVIEETQHQSLVGVGKKVDNVLHTLIGMEQAQSQRHSDAQAQSRNYSRESEGEQRKHDMRTDFLAAIAQEHNQRMEEMMMLLCKEVATSAECRTQSEHLSTQLSHLENLVVRVEQHVCSTLGGVGGVGGVDGVANIVAGSIMAEQAEGGASGVVHLASMMAEQRPVIYWIRFDSI